jgi:hypothetical protein
MGASYLTSDDRHQHAAAFWLPNGADLFGAGQVGDGAGNFQDAVVGAGREAEGFDGLFEDLLAAGSEVAKTLDLAGGYLGIAVM